jgi:CBS domain-containing protein
MNNVFLLRKYIPYENDSVVGIFSRRDIAEKAADNDKQKGIVTGCLINMNILLTNMK